MKNLSGLGILEKITLSTMERVERSKQFMPMEEVKAKAQAKAQALAEAAAKANALARAEAAATTIAKIGDPSQASNLQHADNLPHAGDPPQAGTTPTLPFEAALKKSGLSFICEVKKASPSKGIIADDFPWLDIAREYEEAGASAVSVLTEPEFFLGADHHLQEIAKEIKLPCLRKDFIIDLHQIYEAKLLGAEAVLFISALLDVDTLKEFLTRAEEVKLSALVEVHNEEEAKEAIFSGAKIIGINNRDLKTFNVDLNISASIKKIIPDDIVTVSESGINSNKDIEFIYSLGFDAVLIGESFMRSPNKKKFLSELKQGI